MKKASFVLKALKILGLEDIQSLAQVAGQKQTALKKAAGEELIVWDDVPSPKKSSSKSSDPKDNVLAFKQKNAQFAPPEESDKKTEDDENGPKIMSSEMLLWQREMHRESIEISHKTEAMKGYQRASEMYLVKTQSLDGQEKIKFLSTQGVLVNKKQA
ncbi:MAG: hypothetical protein AB7I27_08525 [Bacteriovoracaceae bacterium]